MLENPHELRTRAPIYQQSPQVLSTKNTSPSVSSSLLQPRTIHRTLIFMTPYQPYANRTAATAWLETLLPATTIITYPKNSSRATAMTSLISCAKTSLARTQNCDIRLLKEP